MTPTPDAALLAILAHLDRVGRLPRGWDGYDADPISPVLLADARALVGSLDVAELGYPTPVPMTRGRLQLEWHEGLRSLELEFEAPGRLRYLKWSPPHGAEDEGTLDAADLDGVRALVRWFHRTDA